MNYRPLVGARVNLSISGGGAASPGYPPSQVNRIVLQFVAALVGQGSGVAFGHDWRDDGVMEAVHGFAQQVRGPLPVRSRSDPSVLLVNLVPWPDPPALTTADRGRLRETLRVEQAGLPEELKPYAKKALTAGPESPLHIFLRARGLTHLRHRLGAVSNARVCLGGPEVSSGRYPGIIEEAYLAVEGKVPLYLSGLLGGVAQQLTNALRGSRLPGRFASKAKGRGLYARPPVVERSKLTTEDRTYDPAGVWRAFGRLGIDGLSQLNRLTPEENEELFATHAVERVIALVLTGISRLQAERTTERGG